MGEGKETQVGFRCVLLIAVVLKKPAVLSAYRRERGNLCEMRKGGELAVENIPCALVACAGTFERKFWGESYFRKELNVPQSLSLSPSPLSVIDALSLSVFFLLFSVSVS